MNSTVIRSRPKGTALSEIWECIEPELASVEQLLQRELRSDAPFVDDLLRYVAALSGKRLRPALVLLAGKACGELTGDHVVLAAVMEMIHTATLVHDDVLDAADMRRHRPTVHRKWSTSASILLGDHLFSRAFYLASTLNDTFACRTIGQSTNVVCEGELRQIGQCGSQHTSEAEYFAIIGAKTAELCACCCLLGAHYAGANSTLSNTLKLFGYQLGLAFQIADDLLDLEGDATLVGKTLGTDLATRKLTLPWIHYYSLQAPESASTSDHGHGGTELTLFDWVQKLTATGSLEYTRSRAERYSALAREAITRLPESPARRALELLCERVVHRRV